MKGPYLNRTDAAMHLGMRPATFDRKVRKYNIPRYCEGRRYSLADLEAWAEDCCCFMKDGNHTGRRPAGGFRPVAV